MSAEVSCSYLEGRQLERRWSAFVSVAANALFIAVAFYVSWWIFQDPRGLMRLYTPYVGYMYCRWLLIMLIVIAYVFDFWPFSDKWLRTTHPLLKAAILTAIAWVMMMLLIKGFFMGLLGNLGLSYFSPDRLVELGVVEFWGIEYAATAIMMFAAIASWLAPSWVVACEGAPWRSLGRGARGFSIVAVTFLLSLIVYLVTMHSHMAILFYPWQQFTAITPPYWEGFADTVSGNFHIAWIMSCTVVVWLFETTFERYPFCLIKNATLRRVASFFGIIVIALCLAFFLYFLQELAWGEAIRGSRRREAPDWRWLHVGEMAIFWLVPCLFVAFYCNNWPHKGPKPVRVLIRVVVTILATLVLYTVYYKTSHLFLGTQKGYSHPQQFPMIPMIWLINIFLINHFFMDNWPGWKLRDRSAQQLAAAVEDEPVKNPVRFWSGLATGVLVGIVAYFITVYLVPLISASITIVEG